MMKRSVNKKAGLTMVETLFYISIFAVLSIVIINAMIYMTGSFRETSVQAELMRGGEIMEKISREIKQADSINTISSTSLKLNTKNESGQSKTVTFILVGSNMQFLEDDILTGNLNAATILVTNVNFTNITTAVSTAVKLSFSISSSRDVQNRTYDFYDTLILRGSY
jgi:Tfp pilus assembly protein PilE